MEYKLGQWAPDLGELVDEGLIECKNCLPHSSHYEYLPSLQSITGAISARAQGAFSAISNSGSVFNFVGDNNKLYLLNEITWNNVSRVALYSTSIEERWFFTKYGERILTTNFTNPIQSYVMGTSSIFADLNVTASATVTPRARYMAVMNNFLLTANIVDTSGTMPNRIRWPSLTNVQEWTVGVANQAGYVDLLSDYGVIKQIMGGEYGVVFQQQAIWRINYVGPPTIFEITLAVRGIGTNAPASVVAKNMSWYFLGEDGYYVFNGEQAASISDELVSEFFYNDFDKSFPSRIVGCDFPDLMCIIWIYPSNSTPAGIAPGTCDHALIYNYEANAVNRWTFCDAFVLEHIFISLSVGYVINDLDTFLTADTMLADLSGYVWDSPVWQGGVRVLSGFSSAHKLQSFEGDAYTATFTTPLLNLADDQIANVTAIRPIINKVTSLTAEIGFKNLITEDITTQAGYTLNNYGEICCRIAARFQQYRIQTTGNFNQARGIKIEQMRAGGKR